LARALTWLGYPLTHQRRRELWCKVDVDKTDSIDDGEFLKLIRLLREEENVFAQNLLNSALKGRSSEEASEFLHKNGIKDMLNKMGYAPPSAMLAQALKMSSDSSGDGMPDLMGIIAILRFVREGMVTRLRQCAGLPDNMAQKVKSKFQKSIDAGKGIESEDLLRFMMELFKGMKNKAAEKERMKHLINSSLGKKADLDLNETFWVVRHYDDLRSEDAWKREEDAAQQSGFCAAEVASFREAFVKSDADGSGYLSQKEIQEVFEAVIKLSPAQHQILAKQMHSMVGEERDSIDFAAFLKLMRVVKHGEDVQASH